MWGLRTDITTVTTTLIKIKSVMAISIYTKGNFFLPQMTKKYVELTE